jgi:hypothetical protein
VDVEVDSVSTGDGDDTGSDDGVGGQHGKPASS